MTREEAIVVFKAFMDNSLFSDVHKAAFSIAIHDIKQRHDWNINKLMLVPKTEGEQEPTTKNDLEVDCISRDDTLRIMRVNQLIHDGEWAMKLSMNEIKDLPSVTPQEPFKPMVEIDLYSVIKQSYIEREVLDKIRTEIDKAYEELDGYDPYSLGTFACRIDEIIDKYKAESEDK